MLNRTSIRLWIIVLCWSCATFLPLCRGDLHEWLEDTLDLDLHRRADLTYKVRRDGAQLSNAVVYEKTQAHYKRQIGSFATELGIAELLEYMTMITSVEQKGVEYMERSRERRSLLPSHSYDKEEDEERENDIYSYTHLVNGNNDGNDKGRRALSMEYGIEVPTPLAAHRLLTTYFPTPSSEIEALKSIYDATGGSNWTIPAILLQVRSLLFLCHYHTCDYANCTNLSFSLHYIQPHTPHSIIPSSSLTVVQSISYNREVLLLGISLPTAVLVMDTVATLVPTPGRALCAPVATVPLSRRVTYTTCITATMTGEQLFPISIIVTVTVPLLCWSNIH